MADTKVSEIIAESLDNVRGIVDANTIIGSPIEAGGGTVIIPVSRLSVGIASGGLDFPSKGKKDSADKKSEGNHFGGGGGTGLSMTPVAFLVIHADGSVELMNIANPTDKATDIGYNISSLLDRAPEIVDKIKSFFKKKDDKLDGAGKVHIDEKQEKSDMNGDTK